MEVRINWNIRGWTAQWPEGINMGKGTQAYSQRLSGGS